jgi:hypothetical protein
MSMGRFRLSSSQVPLSQGACPLVATAERACAAANARLARLRPANARIVDGRPPAATGQRLNAFLADPAGESTRIPAREDARGHLIQMAARHQCDIRHTLDRKGSPYALILNKTTASYERAVREFETNLRLLSELPAEDD